MSDYDKLMERKNDKYMIGVTIAIVLFVLTIGEYMLADAGANWMEVFLMIAMIKAFLVVRDYMHIKRVFVSEEEG
jgi:hypothetical protein